MTNVTGLKICHHTVSEDQNYTVAEFEPIESKSMVLDSINVMWRPGQYDILYNKDEINWDSYDYKGATIDGIPFAQPPETPFSKFQNLKSLISALWPEIPAMLNRFAKYGFPKIGDIESM